MALFLLWYPSLVHFCFFFIPPIFNHPQTPSPPNLISNYFCSCSFSHLVLADQKIVNKAVCWVHFCEYSETVRPELCRCNIEVQTFTLWSYVMITVKKKKQLVLFMTVSAIISDESFQVYKAYKCFVSVLLSWRLYGCNGFPIYLCYKLFVNLLSWLWKCK